MRLNTILGFVADSAGQTIFIFILLTGVANVCGVEFFGIFAFATAIAGVQQLIANFGTQQLIYGKSAAHPSVHRSAIWSAFIITLTVSLLLYGSTFLILEAVGMDAAATLYLFAGCRVLGAVSIPLTYDAQARHAINDYVPYRITTLTLGLAAAFTAWSLEADTLVFAAIFGLEPLLYAALLSASAVRRRRLRRPARPRYRVLLIKAAPIAFQNIMVGICYRFDQIYIKSRFGDVALAQYAAPVRLAEVGNLAFGVVVLVLAPPLIRQIQARNKVSAFLQVGLWSVAGLAVGASLLSLVIGNAILGFIFGNAVSGGANVLAVYVLSTAFVAYLSLAAQVLSARGETGVQAIAGSVAAAVSVVATVILCELLGIIGAAWGTVLAYGAMAAIMWIRIGRFDSRQNRISRVDETTLS
jgi:O-antigen/teichoic acid export membrane protein